MTAKKEKQSEAKGLRIYCHRCNQKLDITNLRAFDKVPCPTCGAQLIVPKWFESYLLEEECGVGGGAVVYRSLDVTLDREIAIKIFKESSDTSLFTKIFLHEGRVAASLNHSGIVPIYSCGQSEGKCFLIMQYMPNGTLEDQIKKNSPLKISQVLTWMLDTSIALQYALQAGVVHHDVKPANILLDSDNSAKISDFGLAYALHDAQSHSLLSELSSYGSPDYVSPEKVENGSEDDKGDVFSLGVTFYELLTGRKPYKHAREDDDILEVRSCSKVLDPSEIRPEISINLSKFVMRMMDPDPARRPEYDKIIAEIKLYLKKYKKYENKFFYPLVAKHL